MATNTLKTRIQHKNGSASDWSQATTFVPLKGELIIYNDATAPKIKVGDGSTLVENLPFVGASITMNGAIASSPSFYAPTSAGTSNQVLVSRGSQYSPTWTDSLTLTTLNIGTTGSTTSSQLTYGRLGTDNTTKYQANTYISGGGTYFIDIIKNSATPYPNRFWLSATETGSTIPINAARGLISAADNRLFLEPGDNEVAMLTVYTNGVKAYGIHRNTDSNSLKTHYYTNGTWAAGYTLLDENNYATYTVTKTGSGASGTWDITANYAKFLESDDTGACFRSTKNSTALLIGRCDNVTNWSTERDGTDQQMREHYYSSDGTYLAGHIGLNSGNYSNYALPLTGGTLTGDLKAKGQFQSQSTSTYQYPGLWFRNDENVDVGAVYMKPSVDNNLNLRWKRDDGDGDGFYYIHCKAADGSVTAPKFEGTFEAGSTTSTTYKHFRVSRLSTDGNYAQGFFYVTGSGTAAQIGVSKNGTTIGTATFGTNFQHTGKVIAAGATFSQDVVMSGSSAITSSHTGGSYYLSRDIALIKHTAHIASSSYSPIYSLKGLSGDFSSGLIHYASGESKLQWIYVLDNNYNAGTNEYTSLMTLTSTGTLTAASVYGAVWNDYAEYRSQNEELKPGYITYCDDDGKLKLTTERLQKYEGVVSDTFGFAIGETDDCKTPLAVSGRALVYCDPEEEHFHSGDCVCAGPDGLAYRMTREEIIEFPDRIVGVVSEIPTYETWGTGNVKVDGRIWIKVK